MSLRRLQRWLGKQVWDSRTAGRPRHQPGMRFRPCVEALEDRLAPALFTVQNTLDAGPGSLRQAILDANNESVHPGADTIQFDAKLAGQTITLTTVGDTSNGPSAFLVSSPITIMGPAANPIIIARSSDAKTPNFRLFDVTTTGNLAVQNLTLSGGSLRGSDGGYTAIYGNGGSVQGGGIYSSGMLSLTNTTLSHNAATGGNGGPNAIYGNGGTVQGGGIYSSGTLSLSSTALSSNSATGGNGGFEAYDGDGGLVQGGGIYSSGTLSLTNTTLSHNAATGGNGGAYALNSSGGLVQGGGIYNSGMLSPTNTTLSNNTATGGNGGPNAYSGPGGNVQGGVIYSSGMLSLSSTTLSSNSATGGNPGSQADVGSGGSVQGSAIYYGLPTSALPDARYGSNYTQAVTLTGGSSPGFSFGLADGSTLPPGLLLDPQTGQLSGQPTASGSFSFTVAGADSSGDFGVHPYTLTVDKVALTITANSTTKTYGQTVSFAGSEFTASGLVNTDTVTSVTLSSTGASATATVSGSPYAIVPSNAQGTGLSNYTIAYNSGALTVTAKTLTLTANSTSKTYGQTLTFAGTEFQSSGLVNSDTVTSVFLSSTGAAAAASVSGSPYAILISNAQGTGLSNYTIAYNSGSLTVTAKTLTLTANSTSKIYGQTVTFAGSEFTSNGLLGNDAISSVFLSSAGASATASVSGSPYAIVPSNAQGTSLSNYSITYVNGSLTVNPKALTITANSTSKTYGQTVSFAGTEFQSSGLVNSDTVGSVTLASTGVAVTAAVSGSPYAIVPSQAQGTGLANYTIAYSNGRLTVSPAPLTLTANNDSKVYGTLKSFASTAFTAQGLVTANGDSFTAVTLTSSGAAATAPVSPPTYAIVITSGSVQGSGLANYRITLLPGTLTVTPAPLSASGVKVQSYAGAPFSGVVATFTNPDPQGTPASYTAAINWGDGSTSPGTLSASNGLYQVSGSHTYADPKTYNVSVSIQHVLGYTLPGQASSMAMVTTLGQSVQLHQNGSLAFWLSSRGQALLQAFNGGGSSTALANWLASNFPNLYGAAAGSHNLAGQSNAQVAAFLVSYFTPVTLFSLDAEILVTALNVYATTLSLGGTTAQSYGFAVDANGLGAHSVNVGNYAASFGVANNTALNVWELLLATNQAAVGGSAWGSQMLQHFGGLLVLMGLDEQPGSLS